MQKIARDLNEMLEETSSDRRKSVDRCQGGGRLVGIYIKSVYVDRH